MVIYVLNARLECLTNFTIFRFRWFNNWFPYFWINWLGYGLTLGFLLFISIFLDFSVLQFSAAESAWKAKESEKNTSALGEWPGEPENQYPPSGRISIHPRSADTLSLLPHFSHALAALSLALAALSLWAPPPFMSCRVTFTMSASNWDTNSPRLKRASGRETRQLICFCIVFSPGNSCGPQKRSFDLAFCRVGLFRQSYVSHSPTIPSAGHLGYTELVYTNFVIHLA